MFSMHTVQVCLQLRFSPSCFLCRLCSTYFARPEAGRGISRRFSWVVSVGTYLRCDTSRLLQAVRKGTHGANLFVVIVEVVGYVGRQISSTQYPGVIKGPYIMQSVSLLLAPNLLAASIYLVFGRIIVVLDAECHSIIRSNWLIKFFAFGNVMSFSFQVAGIFVSNPWTTPGRPNCLAHCILRIRTSQRCQDPAKHEDGKLSRLKRPLHSYHLDRFIHTYRSYIPMARGRCSDKDGVVH